MGNNKKTKGKNSMKRLLTATAALLLTGGLLTATAAELPPPVKTKLEAAQSDLAKAKSGTQEHARLSALCAAIAAYPETFDEFVKIATDAYNKMPTTRPVVIRQSCLTSFPSPLSGIQMKNISRTVMRMRKKTELTCLIMHCMRQSSA